MMELLLLKLIWMGICFFHLKHRTLWLSQSGMHMPGCTVARAFSSEVARLILLTTAVALTLEDDVIISLEQQARLKETRPRPRRPKRKFCRFCDSWDLFVFPDHHMQTTKTADAHLLVCMQHQPQPVLLRTLVSLSSQGAGPGRGHVPGFGSAALWKQDSLSKRAPSETRHRITVS